MAKPAAANGWAIAHWRGHIYIDTIRLKRKDAVSAFREAYGDEAWDEPYPRCIHRAIKVTVLPIVQLKGN